MKRFKQILAFSLVLILLLQLAVPAMAVETEALESDAEETAALLEESTEEESGEIPYAVTGGSLTFDPDSGMIVGYSGEPTALVIPAEIEGVAVTGIADEAFSDCITLTSVTLPEGLLSIGSSAFYGCTGLTSASLPGTLTEVGSNVFRGCTALESVTLAEGITEIPDYAFYDCTELTAAALPGTLEAIGNYAFYNCGKLTSAKIPDNVTSIGSSVFQYCTSLASVTLPEGIAVISSCLFYGCTALKNIEIPDSVKIIRGYAFNNCPGLTSIEIPDSVTSVEGSAFQNCTGLTSIEIPDGVTMISSDVFCNCTGLTSVTLPKSITMINTYAFSGCTALQEVILPEGLLSIGAKAFYQCTSLTSIEIPSTVTRVDQYAFGGCSQLVSAYFYGNAPTISTLAFNSCASGFKIYYISGKENWTTPTWNGYSTETFVPSPKEDLVSYEVTEGSLTFDPSSGMIVGYSGEPTALVIPAEIEGVAVTGIADEVFSGCITLTSVTLPEGITVIPSNAFNGCTKLTEVALPGTLETIGDGAFYYCCRLTSAEIPDSVTSIGNYAFQFCTRLASVTLQEGVLSIGSGAFYGCSALTSVSLPSTLTEVGSDVFYGCTALVSIALPEGITEIPSNAFCGCTKLTEVVLPGTLETIGDDAFSNCSNLTSIEIPDSVTSIGDSAFFLCESLASVEIPDSVTSIGGSAFMGCTSLASVTLSEGLTAISSDLFYECTALKSIEIPGSVTSIGSSAFQNCTGLTSVEIPDSVTSIEFCAFQDCTGLTSIEIPDSVTWIGGVAFQNCSRLTSVTLPESIATINPHVFDGCTGLTSMEIPGSVTSIDVCAFQNCTSMTAIYLPNTITSISEGAFSGCSDSLKVYGAADSAAAAYASAHGLTFVACDIDAISPVAFSTIGGTSYSVTVTMSADINLPLNITAENEQGVVTSIPAVDTTKVSAGKTVHTFALDLSPLVSGIYQLRFFRSEYGIDKSFTYNIDRTAPSQPEAFQVTPGSLKNILTWDSPVEADISAIRIYRCTDLEAVPELLTELSGRTTVSYTDSNVEDSVEYFYWLSFVDQFSQESSYAGPVGSMPDADTEAPMITSVSPANGGNLTGSVRFTVSASDNKQVKYIAMEVSVDEGSTWTTLDTVATNKTASFTLDSTQYETDTLNVRFLAADIYDNAAYSEAVYVYSIDNDPPEQVTGVWGESTSTTITLHWDDVSSNDFSYFTVERKNSDGNYVTIRSVTSTLGVNITGLIPGTSYTYRVAAYDIHGNKGAYSEPVTVSTQADTSSPVISAMRPASARYNGAIPLVFTVSDDYGIQSLTVQTSRDGVSWSDAGTVSVSSVSTSTTVRYTLDTTQFEEGTLYVRGIAYDVFGNASDSSGSAPHIQYMVDRTAPAAPENLEAVAVSGAVYLTWEQGGEQDLNGYNIYRSTEENGQYTLIKSGVLKVSYTDSAVTAGQTYYYKLTCNDTAGNTSEACSPVAVLVETQPDTEAPQIISISPSDGFVLGSDTPLKVKVYDNQIVMKLYVQYSMDGTAWTELEAMDVNASTSVVTVPLTAADVSGDTLYLKAYCVDGSGLTSETVSHTYTIDKVAPAAPALTVTASPMSITLNWTSANEADLAGFYLYRKADGEENYTYLAQCSNSGALSYSYTDSKVSVEVGYSYYVTAIDARGNQASSEPSDAIQPLNIDIEAPVVRASGDTIGTVGIEMQFSAAGSSDNVGITSYLWDFGDGETSSLLAPVHAYTAVGSYTVTLTVSDAAGNRTSGQISVTVKEKSQVSYLDVAVIDENGTVVPNAGVYFNLGSDEQSITYTDSSGKARITAESGTFDVGVYKSGYLPAKTSVTLISNVTSSVTVTIVQGDIVVGELTVERMTLSEIKAAGIDIADPANQEVFQFEITLTYGADVVQINTVTNKDGDVLVDPKPVTVTNSSNEERVLYPFVFSGGGGGSSSGGSSAGGAYSREELPLVAIIDLPGEATWLKDFFDVRLYVLNQADETFVLDNCSATLNVPAGLTLVESNRTGTSPTVSLGSIAGQSSASAEWILRGDVAGNYTLSADFSGTLRDFNEKITAVFETAEPFRVRNGDNLYMDVMVESAILAYTDGAVRVGLRNEDSEPYYLPNITLQNATFVSSFKTAGLVPVDTDKEILAPGEEIWFDFIIEREDWEALIQNKDSDLYLVNQFSKALGGTQLEITFTEVMPFTIAADKIEVYQVDPDTQALSEIRFIDVTKKGASFGWVPDLVIKTYRLNGSQAYEPCSMDLTIVDSYQMEKKNGEAYTVTSDETGVYYLDGYIISQFSNSETYTLTISSSRAKPVEIPIVVRGGSAVTGALEVYAATMKDGVAVPIYNAEVTVAGTTKFTDTKGYVMFKGVDQGYQSIHIEADGYLPITQLIEVSERTEDTFFLTIDNDPNASRVTSVASTMLDATGSNYTIIPYGSAEGIASFTLNRRIAQGETFQNYCYRVTDSERNVVEEGVFTSDTFMFDISKLKIGYTLSFAVETDAGVSVYTAVNIRVVEAPAFIESILTGALDITSSWSSKVSKSIDLTNIDGHTINALEEFGAVTLLTQLDYKDGDDNTNSLISLVQSYSYNKTESESLFPISVTYEPSGKLTVSFVYGAKETVTSQNGIFGANSLFSLSDSSGNKYCVKAKLSLDMIFSYEALQNKWKLRIVGSESAKDTITLAEAPSKIILASIELELGEEMKWELVETNVGPKETTEILGFLNEGLDYFKVEAAIKAAIGAKIVSKKIVSAAAYVKGGVKAVYSAYWRILLTAEIGHEETFLIWKNTGKLKDQTWEIYTEDDLDNEMISLMEVDENTTALSIEEISSTRWNGSAAGNGVLADNIYGGCDQQIVTLPDGRALMVYTDTDPNRDSSNPTVLNYSICTDGQWSTPKPVCDNGTIDLYPSLALTDRGAAVVWIDFENKLSGAESMTVAEIRDSVYTQMDVCLSYFDQTTSEWSQPVCVAAPGMLSYYPVISRSDNQTMIAWIQNESGTESADSSSPDSIAYVLLKDGSVVSQGTVISTNGAVDCLDLAFSGGKFVMTYQVGDNETAETYTLSFDGSGWSGGKKLSSDQTESAAMKSSSDGTLYYTAGSRLYARRGSESTTLLTSELLVGVKELSVMTVNGVTYLAWTQTDNAASRICVCYINEDGVVSTPVALLESESLLFGLPAIAGTNGRIALLYLSKEYDEDGNAVCKLNELEISAVYDVCLDCVIGSESQLLYPGAAITSYYQCANAALLSETNVTVCVSRSSTGADPISVLTHQKLSGTITWTVPEDYDGEPLYLVVQCESGADCDPANNYAAAGTPFVDLDAVNGRYLGERDNLSLLKLTLENNGPVSATSICVTVTDPLTDTVLYTENVGDLKGGAKKDYTLNVSLDACDYVVISAEPENGDVDGSNNSVSIDRDGDVLLEDDILRFGTCAFLNENGTIGFELDVTNYGDDIEAEVFLCVYDADGKLLRIECTTAVLNSGDTTLTSSLALPAAQLDEANHTAVIIVEKNTFAPLREKEMYYMHDEAQIR